MSAWSSHHRLFTFHSSIVVAVESQTNNVDNNFENNMVIYCLSHPHCHCEARCGFFSRRKPHLPTVVSAMNVCSKTMPAVEKKAGVSTDAASFAERPKHQRKRVLFCHSMPQPKLICARNRVCVSVCWKPPLFPSECQSNTSTTLHPFE